MEEYLNFCVVFFFNQLWDMGMTKIETPVGLYHFQNDFYKWLMF
jgi:hypothetical protein